MVVKTIKEREMSLFNIKNSQLSLEIDSFGAEIKSLKKNATQTEYMWNADPKYWKRTSPVLFPIVGILKNGKYTYNKKEYKMSQHGFARDMEFELKSQSEDEIVFLLKANSETLAKYPFNFALEVGYKLDESSVIVSWKVCNLDSKEMYFSIGGHPAFMCPIEEGTDQTDCKLLFDTKDNTIISSEIGENGTLLLWKKGLVLHNGYMNIKENLFDDDALIIENNQAHKVSLCDKEGKPYISVSFDAPLFGIWSPAKKKAPFICIEPWYGRCDKSIFSGDLSQREWGNKLACNENFYAEYSINIL